MDNQLISWIISLITGALGGNIAGALMKNWSLGPVGNSIVGILGGGLGGQIIGSLLGGGAGAPSLLGNVAESGIGGAVLMIIVGLIKNALAKGKTA